MRRANVNPLELLRRTQISERMSSSYDVIVVGAGPAGLTAATSAARSGLKALCLDKLAPGGALINLAELHEVDHLGGGHADGPQIASQLTDDATNAGVELGFGEEDDPREKRQLGNFPQAFSHVALVSCARILGDEDMLLARRD